MAKAPWKWVGGKQQLVGLLKQFVPAKFNSYFEPMVGAGSLFYALEPGRAWINDRSRIVADAHQALQKDPQEVLVNLYKHQRALKKLPRFRKGKETRSHKMKRLEGIRQKDIKCQEDYYYWMRTTFNRDAIRTKPKQSLFFRASQFIALMKTCHGGVWRVNAAGKMNCPFDKSTKCQLVDEATIHQAHLALQGATITFGDFEQIAEHPGEGDVVYLDPPYEGTYDGYGEGGFSLYDQCRVAELARRCAQQGAKVIVSNSCTENVLRLYQERGGSKLFDFWRIDGPRSVSRDVSLRGPTEDLLIVSR